MCEHYKSEQHQIAIINFVHRDLAKVANDQNESSGMHVKSHRHRIISSFDSTNSRLQEVRETIDTLVDGVQIMKEDEQRLNNELVQMHNQLDILIRNFEKLKLSVQEQNRAIDGSRSNYETLDEEVASLKQRTEDLHLVPYNGTLTWKVSNVRGKIGETYLEDSSMQSNRLLYFR